MDGLIKQSLNAIITQVKNNWITTKKAWEEAYQLWLNQKITSDEFAQFNKDIGLVKEEIYNKIFLKG